jgi:hypothetical protein
MKIRRQLMVRYIELIIKLGRVIFKETLLSFAIFMCLYYIY